MDSDIELSLFMCCSGEFAQYRETQLCQEAPGGEMPELFCAFQMTELDSIPMLLKIRVDSE
jgi:hypothetical protein